MPLAFESESHGTIAFGFFNIESDMLLLDQYFFFASDFCTAVIEFVQQSKTNEITVSLPAYCIDNQVDIGDLHGAINGSHHSGFIGETYKKYPFPKQMADFKQQTRGYETRTEFKLLIGKYSSSCQLLLENKQQTFNLGCYYFTSRNFIKLVEYVLQGGYPGWLEGIAPDYVLKMQQQLKAQASDMFDF